MSETLQIWLFGGVAVALIGVCALWWRHTAGCESQRIKLATAIQEVRSDHDRLFYEVGRTHDSGLRDRMRRLENTVSPSFIKWQVEQERKGVER